MADVSFGFHNKGVQDQINFHYQKIHTQGIQMYGNEVYYLRYHINKDLVDQVFVEQQNKTYNEIYRMKMYPDDVSRMEGNGDLFSKFGLEVQDEITLYVSRIDFYEKVSGEEVTLTNFADIEKLTLDIENDITPKIDDLIYIPFWNTVFELNYNEEQENMIYGNAFYKFSLKKWRPDSDITIELDVTGTGVDTEIVDYMNAYIDGVYTDDKDFTQTGESMIMSDIMNEESRNIGETLRDEDQGGEEDYWGGWK